MIAHWYLELNIVKLLICQTVKKNVCPSVGAMKNIDFHPIPLHYSNQHPHLKGHKYVQIPLRNHGFQGVFHMNRGCGFCV